MGEAPAAQFTERLRLEPVSPSHAHDLWVVHNDAEVVPWYDGRKPSLEEAEKQAKLMHSCWRELGVHKWMAYDRDSDELVGRGGLSRTPADDDWGRIYAFLPPEPWARALHGGSRGVPVHANWLRSDGHYDDSSGAAATHPRSGEQDWTLPSTFSACRRWCPAPCATTSGLER